MNEPRLLGDRYELGEVIGRGGMAEVRRGRDTRLGRIVALKMLRVDHAGDSTFQARFRREAQSAASLNHSTIVAVYDTGEDDVDGHRVPYIVMEYVEGQTLREMVQAGVRFTPERASEVVSEVLDALEYSHRAGIVHRDIKPGNVMITTGGEVKVMDFGIARSLADTGMALTQTAAVVGTAQYISPEQARGEQADARSDLYASGCVLYELLTGRPPFIGESLVSVAVSHVREMPTPPSALDPSIPADLDAIVMKSLSKDRLERYQSAYEMRADLQRAAGGLPVMAAADTSAATQLIGHAPAQNQTEAMPLGDDTPVPDEDDDGRRGFSWWAVALGALAVLAIAGLLGYLVFASDGPSQVSVPDLVGETQEDAESRLQDDGLEVDAQSEETDDEGAVGNVIQQDPGPQDRVDEGSAVTIVVGVAPDQVSVPSVVGANLEEATQQIEDAGLTPGNRTEENSDRPENEVLSTEPDGGDSVDPGTTVNITYSSGTQTVEVPDLVGNDQAQAEAELQRLGLEPDVVTQEADEPAGTVFSQQPEPGSEVDEGETVIINVAEESDDSTETPTDDPTGDDSGTDTGTDTGTDSGTDTGTDSGTDTGNDTGDETGNDTGNETGTDSGTDSGTDNGTDSGTEWGSEEGNVIG